MKVTRLASLFLSGRGSLFVSSIKGRMRVYSPTNFNIQFKMLTPMLIINV